MKDFEMKMDNLRQRREHLQSAELRLKQKILDHDKYIIVCIIILFICELEILFFSVSNSRHSKTTFIVMTLNFWCF